MPVIQLMKLMVPMLQSQRTSMTQSVLETGRNPANQAAAIRAPTRTTIGNPIGAVVTCLIVTLVSLALLVVIAIAHAETTLNIA
eukprot:15351387-Ditylum_brightwellii.AAC.1